MTRKHFELIASAIKSTHTLEHLDEATINAVALNVASALKSTNPSFNMQRFLAACR